VRTNCTAEAETYLRKTASLDPEGYNVNFAMGVLAQMRGDRTLAERQYYEELRFHPDNRSAKLSLAALNAGK
jgi:Tfp pilus assembly protein PilF